MGKVALAPVQSDPSSDPQSAGGWPTGYGLEGEDQDLHNHALQHWTSLVATQEWLTRSLSTPFDEALVPVLLTSLLKQNSREIKEKALPQHAQEGAFDNRSPWPHYNQPQRSRPHPMGRLVTRNLQRAEDPTPFQR